MAAVTMVPRRAAVPRARLPNRFTIAWNAVEGVGALAAVESVRPWRAERLEDTCCG